MDGVVEKMFGLEVFPRFVENLVLLIAKLALPAISVLILLGITVNLSHIVHMIPSSVRGHGDWLLHFCLYFAFSTMWFFKFRISFLTIPIVMFVAMFTEVFQGFRQDLDFSFLDLFANMSGAFCGSMFATFILTYCGRRLRNKNT